MPNLPVQTLLGFDFGLRHIGVAIGQTLTGTARGLTSLRAVAGQPDWPKITQLITTWRPEALVVGIPYQQDGTAQALTHAARCFANALQQRYALPVHRVDERFTTVAARAQLFETGGYRALTKAAIDQRAAQLILQNWLAAQSPATAD